MSNNNKQENGRLSHLAREAVTLYPDSDIEVALAFCQRACPAFAVASNDRLVKTGRGIVSLIAEYGSSQENHDAFMLEAGLALLVEECELLVAGRVKVPKVKFGKTGLAMPVVTLGCMRFQQEWGPRITKMNQVGSDCQDNLVEILKQAIGFGINHIETARGYGCSELQLGVALKQLYSTSQIKRENLIIQTKIPPNEDPEAFRAAMETSLRCLQVDYLDLFAFHGFNFDEQMDWVFGNGGNNCFSVIQEYIKAGKVRHLGFSTHGSTDLILKLINMDVFDYVNLHYHYFGSYTASGGGHDGNGNLECAKLAKAKNMGCFVISPFDKGGGVYAPSRKLRSLTLPEMEPMAFSSFWIWNHHRLFSDHNVPLHTFTVGAARPSDLDQPAVAAYLQATKADDILANVKAVTKRLDEAKELALGKHWVETWWQGLPKATGSKHLVEHNQIVWIYNCIKAFGIYNFGKARYHSFEMNQAKWDDSLPPDKNIADKIGKNMWGFVPGLSLKPGEDYAEDLASVPAANKTRVSEAEAFVYKWCAAQAPTQQELEQSAETAEEGPHQAGTECEPVPEEWKTAYDMRSWPDFPDRPPRL